MNRSPLARLERLKDTYGPGAGRRKLELLRALARARLRSAREVLRLHEALLFLRAYPDDARVLARARRMLARFEERADLRRFAQALEGSGIAGTAWRYPFFWSTAVWLARRCGARLSFDRGDALAEAGIAAVLPLLVGAGEALWLREAKPAGFEALERLRPRGTSDAVYFLERLEGLAASAPVRESLHDSIDPLYRLELSGGAPSRTRAECRTASIVLQRGPILRARPDLRAEIALAPRRVRAVPAAEGRALLDLARGCMVTRARDLDAFAYGNPRDVHLAEHGRGLAFALNGFLPERRQLLWAGLGFLTLRNGVPAGYGQLDAFGGLCAVSFNTFDTFRGADAAWTFARVLASARALLGVDSFCLDPYQIGKDNPEALASGAWWFYYKLGFRPRARPALSLVRCELERLREHRGYRSSEAALAHLARWPLYFDLDRARPAPALSLADIGKRMAEEIAARGGGERGIAACEQAALRAAALRSLRGFGPAERAAWRRWSPLIASVAGLKRRPARERRALAAIVRAKAAGSEFEFQRRLRLHPGLERALLAAPARADRRRRS